jgi:hypothetical protein
VTNRIAPSVIGNGIRVRAVFCAHGVAVCASAFVVYSNTILSDRELQTVIALPLISTIVFGPIAMICVTSALDWKSRMRAIIADLSLSALQS